MGSHVSIKKHQINITLKTAISNITNKKIKRMEQIEVKKNQIVEYMLNNNETSALIKTEEMIIHENLVLCYDVLDYFCQQIQDRINILENYKEIQPDMIMTFASIIYAAPLCDIDEIPVLRKQIGLMYGDQFVKK